MPGGSRCNPVSRPPRVRRAALVLSRVPRYNPVRRRRPDHVTVRLRLKEGLDTSVLFGTFDQNLREVEDAFGVTIRARGEELRIDGEPNAVRRAERLLTTLASRLQRTPKLQPEDIADVIRSARRRPDEAQEVGPDEGAVRTKKRVLTPKSPHQREYLEALKTADIVVGIGPAGTGKTYLAMGMAVAALTKREVARIVLTRPAVEAGEKLGFLPGDMYAKVNPYLRPMYDALYDMMEMEQANRLVERGEIEIAPLAYMRGRTLNDAFIILDEAQNVTPEQMKMFLTRLGFRSKAVITGDITQVDLPAESPSGLIEVQAIVRDVPGIAFVYFDDRDVVRHRLVQEIIKAYERYESRSGAKRKR
ncbi:MAG: PhoH family protein [Nitrospirae bacterium]|nr:PhoH family protein [Nitrospirota bacterium]